MHHVVLAEVARSEPGDPGETALAASQFLLEVLASFEMVRTPATGPAAPGDRH